MDCLLSRLAEAGFRVVPFGSAADWIVVNTCTVTATADSDSRQAVRRAVRGKGGGRLLVTGCMAQRASDIIAGIEGVDLVIGNREKAGLAEYVLTGLEPAYSGPSGNDPCRVAVGEDPTHGSFVPYGSGQLKRRTRALLKIQDGCDHGCSFCVIPAVRGSSRSRSLEDTFTEAERLAAGGHAEVALTGINTALWGRDLPGCRQLPDLLDALAGVSGLGRIRLNSLEPQYLQPDWLDRFAANPRLCPHFHLPLQSGDPGILEAMRRSYTPRDYAELVTGLCGRIPGAAVGADVLVGFPGEGEAEFDATRAFLESLPLAYLHVFRFSPRPGTPAFSMGMRVGDYTARARSRLLRELGGRLKARFAEKQIGAVHHVIPERETAPGVWTGLTGNYMRVEFPWSGEGNPAARLIRVRLSSADGRGGLTGERV